jgi:hypothetical protein
MFNQAYRNPKNIILEVFQPTKTGNVDPSRPPRGGSAVVRRPDTPAPKPHAGNPKPQLRRPAS